MRWKLLQIFMWFRFTKGEFLTYIAALYMSKGRTLESLNYLNKNQSNNNRLSYLAIIIAHNSQLRRVFFFAAKAAFTLLFETCCPRFSRTMDSSVERVGAGHCRKRHLAARTTSWRRSWCVETTLRWEWEMAGQVSGSHAKSGSPLKVYCRIPVIRIIVRALSWWRKTWQCKNY